MGCVGCAALLYTFMLLHIAVIFLCFYSSDQSQGWRIRGLEGEGEGEREGKGESE